MSGPSDWDYVYHHVATIDPQPASASLLDQIIIVLRDRLGIDPILAEKKAESRLGRYANLLRERIENDAERGVAAYVQLEPGGTKINWNHIILSGLDNRSKRMNKIRLLRRPGIVRQIRAMSPDQFENIFKIFDKYCNVQKYAITQRSDEFGVDSVAVVENFSSFGLFLPNTISHKLVVQSKKYQSAITRDKIQVLNDTLNLIRTRSANVIRHIPTWFWAADGTISGWLIADKGFQSGTVEYAKDNGILLTDIYDLANIICFGRHFDPYSSHNLVESL